MDVIVVGGVEVTPEDVLLVDCLFEQLGEDVLFAGGKALYRVEHLLDRERLFLQGDHRLIKILPQFLPRHRAIILIRHHKMLRRHLHIHPDLLSILFEDAHKRPLALQVLGCFGG